MKAGQIVEAVAGRDKNTFFVVTQINGNFAFICNGKERPVQKQKKKKIIHLKETGKSVDLNNVKTNKEFKKVLHQFNYPQHHKEVI